MYDEISRIDRLPKYLTTHFVRFYWRREINKKTKIMRKVKFPFVLDATPFLSDELKKKLGPATKKLQAIEKEREEREKIRKKARGARDEMEKIRKEEAKKSESSTAPLPSVSGDAMDVDSKPAENTEGLSEGSKAALGSAITEEEEKELRIKEKKEFEESINEEVRKDVGANVTALYELVGIVTHKGAAADAGHYISWVRKEGREGEETKKGEKDEMWYKVSRDLIQLSI